ncbi:hypothetical protein ACFC0M_09065 [Streptomyces sp. NPDC056149]|uniref:hypothetical protein n=1 Tax=unclassified Streptomyces TaxID=2593676 RepID=UPI00238146A4|nr:hypothetical protein [Streptomyces sp. WZ-12]
MTNSPEEKGSYAYGSGSGSSSHSGSRSGGGSSSSSSSGSAAGAPDTAGAILSPSGNYYQRGQFCKKAHLGLTTRDAHGNPLHCAMQSGRPHWQ